MKHPALFLLVFFYGLNLFSQPLLEKSCNMFRSGDKLIKQQIEFKDPGESGSNMFWDFSGQKTINDDYTLSFSSYNNDSTVIGREHRTLYEYLLRGDSLFLCKNENPNTLIKYIKPELLLTFPFTYRTQKQDYFYGVGEYSRHMSLITQGVNTIHADAYGMMVLPGGDTLHNVLRVHHLKRMTERMQPRRHRAKMDTVPASLDSINYYLSTDSVVYEIETYRWYSEGYRYPVFETIKSTVYKYQNAIEHFSTAFYYTPVEQYYGLKNDPENLEKREHIKERNRKKSNENKNKKGNINNPLNESSSNIIHTLSLNENSNSLTLDYQLLNDTEVTILLFDTSGKTLETFPKTKQLAGSYQQTISLDKYLQGEYLFKIIADETVISEKILKK